MCSVPTQLFKHRTKIKVKNSTRSQDILNNLEVFDSSVSVLLFTNRAVYRFMGTQSYDILPMTDVTNALL